MKETSWSQGFDPTIVTGNRNKRYPKADTQKRRNDLREIVTSQARFPVRAGGPCNRPSRLRMLWLTRPTLWIENWHIIRSPPCHYIQRREPRRRSPHRID